MILKQTNLNIRASQAEKAMLEQVAQANETTPSEMMRQLIREAHAKLQENIMAQSIQDLVDVARSHEVAARRAEMEAHKLGLDPGARFQSWNPHAQAAFDARAVALKAEQDALEEWNRTK